MNGLGEMVAGGRSDGDRMLAEATRLAIPRYPGTPGDRDTIATMERTLRSSGLVTDVQEFSYSIAPATWALRAVLVAGGLLVGVAGFVAMGSPALAGFGLVAALVPGVLFLAWSPWVERLYRGEGSTHTANVVGRTAVSDPRLTLVVMAHHDSKSQSLSLPGRMALTIAAVTGSLTLSVVVVTGVVVGHPVGPEWLAPVAGGAAAAAALALSTLRSGNRSPGGVDNAGSLAILLELARTLPAAVPADVELVFLSTGAEEDHMVGAMRWLEANSGLGVGHPAYCLNLDGAGAPGRTVLIERYGLGRRFSAILSAAARRAAADLGDRVRGILMLPGIGIDAIPFAHRGIECLTLSSGSLGRATMSVHSARDLPEHLDAATLGRVCALARRILLDLTRELA